MVDVFGIVCGAPSLVALSLSSDLEVETWFAIEADVERVQ